MTHVNTYKYQTSINIHIILILIEYFMFRVGKIILALFYLHFEITISLKIIQL